MKRTLALTLMTLLAGVCTMAQSVDIDGIYYNLDATTKSATVTSGETRYTGDVAIPATVTYEEVTYNVTTIGDAAFELCTTLNSVTIPEGVTTIGNNAFNNCVSLTSVTLPQSLTTIGSTAFMWCMNLYDVTIPENVTTIGQRAFMYCTALTSIALSKNVTSIGAGAFAACTKLTSIEVDGENANFTSSDGVLYNKDLTALIQYPVGNANTSYTIPNSVTTIGICAFESNSTLKTITIPEDATTIMARAFMNCDALTSIDIPESMTTIGSSAFYSCEALTGVAIHKDLTTIGEEAFAHCTAMTAITVDAENPNYTSVDGVMFDKNKTTLIQYPLGNAAESYVIPDGVTTITNLAFYGSQSLANITIPASVTTIDIDVFAECPSLASINIDDQNPNYASIDGVLFNKDKTILIQYPIGNENSTYTIPDGVTTIGGFAFEFCDNLTTVNIAKSVTVINESAFRKCTSLTAITIPSNVTTIGDNVFFDCDALTSVTLEEGVTTIGEAAFMDCSALTTITLPASVTEIGPGAFYNNLAFTSITCKAVTPPTITSSAFPNIDREIPLYVPAESIDLYKSATDWKEFTNILSLGQATAIDDISSDDITVSFTGGNIVVIGTDDYMVYSISGQCLGKQTNVESGIYIVVAKGKSFKVIAR